MEVEIKKYGSEGSRDLDRKPETQRTQFEVEGLSLQHLFENSLRGLAHLLRRGSCSSATHYDCLMKIDISAADQKTLLVDFLAQVLNMTHSHQAIFCRMHVEEFSEQKLVANLFGVWFDNFDTEIKSIIGHKCSVEQNEDYSCSGCIEFGL